MSTSWKRITAVSFLVLLGLWSTGIVRAFVFERKEAQPLFAPAPPRAEGYRDYLGTANNLRQIGLADHHFHAAPPGLLEGADFSRIRVFEKTAEIASWTDAFEEDLGRLRQAISSHQGVISTEKSEGLPSRRFLSITIRVPPESFDSLLNILRRLGHPASIQVEQHDRTSDLRQLHIQRASLQQHLDTLRKLRETHNLSVEDALKLEQKALDTEKEMQNLRVQLGDLLDKDPTYNVLLTLGEYEPGSLNDPRSSNLRTLGGALIWAMRWWTVTMLAFGLALATYVSVRVLWWGRPAHGTVAGAPVG